LLLRRAFAPHLLENHTPEPSAIMSSGTGLGRLVEALEATRNVGAVRVTSPEMEITLVRR
jgi:hypothetical protein